MSRRTNLKAVSIFSGAGGLDIGFENAGFDVVSALELHPKYCASITENQKKQLQIPGSKRFYYAGTRILNKDIREVSGLELAAGEQEIDCLIGGPPCQAFSSAGKQLSIFDQRGTLVYEYLRVLKELHPKTFLFENVRGLVTARGLNNEPGEILLGLLAEFKKAGYSCRVGLLNAANYGSCQRRVRCFILGSRIAAAPEFPTETHAEQARESLFPEEKREAWNTLGNFLLRHSDQNESHWTRPTPELYEKLKDLPEGSGLKSRGRVEATRPNGHWGYRQGTFIADTAKPARTVTGSSSQDWIRLSDGSLRRLTLKEAAGLQGFPEGWIFCGSKSDQFQQVGNAVPVVFGEVLGRTLKAHLEAGEKKDARPHAVMVPESILSAIKYTKREEARNGAYRANSFLRKQTP